MRFSIVTISYNQAPFLEAAIRSVVEQEGVALDYIVVDPGSTDGSRAIIDRYRDRIATVLLTPDDGPADGLNKGLAAATGEIFGFVNADDMLEPGALAEVAAAFRENPDSDVVMGDAWEIDGGGGIVRRMASSRRISARLCALQACTIVQQGCFIRTAMMRQVGGFDPTNRTSWDGELYFRLAVAGARFVRVDRVWGRFRIHAGSITGSGALTQRWRADADHVFRRHFGRPRRRLDRIIARATWAYETLRDPRGLSLKLRKAARRAGLPLHRVPPHD